MSCRGRRLRWFRHLVPTTRPLLKAMAKALANGDADLAEDLEQEGLIAMYMMAPRELDGCRHPGQVATGRAWRAMRRFRRNARYKVPVADALGLASWRERQIRRWLS